MHLQRKKENSISIKADSFCLLFRQLMNWPQFSKFKFTSTLHIFLLSIGLLFMAILTSVNNNRQGSPLLYGTFIHGTLSLLQKMHPLERYPSTEGDRYKRSQGYNEDVLQCMVLLRQHFIV